MDKTLFDPVMIGITKEGDWFYFRGDIEKIKEDRWCNETDCIPAFFSPNRGEHRLILCEKDGRRSVPVDVAFPVLHGKNGEDGTVQGLIELAGIPLAGCGVLASALCMDKDRAHRLVRAAGVRVPASVVLKRGEFGRANAAAEGCGGNTGHAGAAAEGCGGNTGHASAAAEGCGENAEHAGAAGMTSALFAGLEAFVRETGYPLFVKPVKAGSSYGVTKVCQPAQLADAVSLAFAYDDEVIVEEAIEGFEVGCAVLGTGTLTTGEADEIELSGGFFDFTEKYTLKTSAIHVPARISGQKAAEIKETAKRIYRALGCSVFARVDMFLTPEGEIVFNEVNTIPGFTEHSRYPGMMKAAGFSFEEILTKIIGLALEKGADGCKIRERKTRA